MIPNHLSRFLLISGLYIDTLLFCGRFLFSFFLLFFFSSSGEVDASKLVLFALSRALSAFFEA